METPENLVNAVNRIKPRAILILDTNTIMNPPRLESYEISMPGPFLLVVPSIVDLELMSVMRGGKDEETRQKASRAYGYLGKLYEQGNQAIGIELRADRWLITTDTPRPDSDSPEDDLVQRILGKVDAALLRLAEACALGCPDTSTLLITKDKKLARATANRGIPVCPLPDLRLPQALDKISIDASPSETLNIEATVTAIVDSDEERAVKIAMTLEELRSEGDYLIARGSGRVNDGEQRYPFRWTFPYQNLSIYNQLTDEYPESAWHAVMPIENVDFMGADEEISETVRRYVCSMLEDAYELNDLQSPLTKVRRSIVWHTQMGSTRGGYLNGPLTEVQKEGLTAEQAETIENLMIQHDRYAQSLFDGSAESVGRVYRAAFNLSEADDEIRGYGPHEYDEFWWDLETSLIEFLDEALGTWAVGETREAEYTHRPYAWPENEEEATIDDEEEVGEETE